MIQVALSAAAAAYSSERDFAKTTDFPEDIRGALVVHDINFIVTSVCIA